MIYLVIVYHATKKKVAVFIVYVFTQSSKTFLLETSYPSSPPQKCSWHTCIYTYVYIHTFLVHTTEAMHRWQFVKKSSAVQTPIFLRNPNHKNTVGKKNPKISNLSRLHLMMPPCTPISPGEVYSRRDATVHISKGLQSKRNNLGAQA